MQRGSKNLQTRTYAHLSTKTVLIGTVETAVKWRAVPTEAAARMTSMSQQIWLQVQGILIP